MNALGFKEVKVIALAVDDLARAEHFYSDTLGLTPAFEGERQVGFQLGGQVLMLKPVAEGWYARPSAELNPRITIATEHAPRTEHELRARGVRISDPVQPCADDGFCVGAFLDSEGNKLWFCSLLAGTLT